MALKADFSEGKIWAIILGISGVAVVFLVWLIYFNTAAATVPLKVRILPAVNASLNAYSALCLVCGYIAVRNRKLFIHKIFMNNAVMASLVFFVSYVIYHSYQGDTKFLGTGPIRPVYFTVLISHIVLSIITLPLIIFTYSMALAGRLPRHKFVARITLPIWLYVSITGVLIFFLLKNFSH